MPEWINDSPKYYDYPLPELHDNPLIACLMPPSPDFREASRCLFRLPRFKKAERDLDSETRKLLPARLANFFIPRRQHVEIFKDIQGKVVNGYIQRNPMKREGQRLLHNAGIAGFRCGPISPSTISMVVGPTGLGKSALMRTIMGALGPAVIQHSRFRNTPFPETQILYLARNIPDQSGTKPLAKTLGDHTDELLQKNLYRKRFADRSMTRTEYVAMLRRILANHHVGVLILDEFQNVSLAGTLGQGELIALLINLRDELGIPIVLVGTHKTENILVNDAAISRRLCEGGFHNLRRPESAEDADWRDFCEIIWQYQWVNKPVSISEEIISVLYDVSQGITGIVLSVFMAAQVEAIDSKKETVNADLLGSVWLRRFVPFHKMIEALRSKNHTLLSRYEDLCSKAFSKLTEDPVFNRLNAMKQDMIRAQENRLGIELPHSKKGSHSTHGKKAAEPARKGSSIALPATLA